MSITKIKDIDGDDVKFEFFEDFFTIWYTSLYFDKNSALELVDSIKKWIEIESEK
jgi:hypothetical protein